MSAAIARMSSACLIIIGIELIKMITSYTIDSVVDVMLLAIARQMIVEHTSPVENLIAVLSIGSICIFRVWTAAAARRRSRRTSAQRFSAWKTVTSRKSRNRPRLAH